ncbi:hypothetical protein FB99_45440 (plasmid) [Pantoea agglomerans]|nr:hypothetical protein FB99_45440 [Pantoea agglomerans]
MLCKSQLRDRITAIQTFFNNNQNAGNMVKLFVRHVHQHQHQHPIKGGENEVNG